MQFLLMLGHDVSITIKPRVRVRSKSLEASLRGGAASSGRGRLIVEEAMAEKGSEAVFERRIG